MQEKLNLELIDGIFIYLSSTFFTERLSQVQTIFQHMNSIPNTNTSLQFNILRWGKDGGGGYRVNSK